MGLLCANLYPCASMKYLDHSILTIEFYIPIIYPSVEILPFIFCFVENLDTDTLPRDIIYPVCTRQSSCTAFDASSHHSTNYMYLTLKVSFNSLVSLRYFNTCFSFTQLYLTGFLTRAPRNTTAVCTSQRALELMNSSCATT